ncbi:30S ribosomal protein S3ae [Sulfolobales archaeon HS-7]|nr:30S ribosomal protein S3ae [Sulfolobales archaeon HS-7]
MSSRSSAIKDKWKMKKWFTVFAPELFSGVPLGQTAAFEGSQIIGRKIETTLYDLTGDFSLVHVKVYFKITKTDNERAYSAFYGHEMARDYIRSLIRRKSSKIQNVVDVVTKDGYKIRVKALILTTYRCQRRQKTDIRKISADLIQKIASESNSNDFISSMLFGKISNEIFNTCKKIYPLRNVEIEKSKVFGQTIISEEKKVESSSISGG